eukprot:gene111-338_t
MALALRQKQGAGAGGEPDAKRPRYELTPALEQALIQVPAELRKSGLQGPTMRLSGHDGEVFGCEFSPDGRHLASASFDNKIYLWNVYGEAENYGKLEGHANAVLEVHWSPDGTHLFSCSADKSVCVWDAETGQRVKKLNGHTAIVNSMQLWDLRIRRCVHSFDHGYQILACTFDDTAEKIFAGSLDNTVRVWDCRTRKEEELYVLEGHNDSITGISLSPDGEKLVTNAMDKSVRIWDVRPFVGDEENRCLNVLQGGQHNYEKNLLRCRWSADGKMIGAGSSDKNVYLWNSATGQLAYALPGHHGSVNDVCFHPKENIICSASSDRTLFMGELS